MPGVSEKELLKLKADGWQSPLIDLRLKYAGYDSVIKYLRPLVGKERIHCHYLPTQKSGRWSITNPPLANFSANCINPTCEHREQEHRATWADCWSLRDVVLPDPGYYFLKFDWQAIEAKLAAAYSGDDEDLELFAQGADIHTVTLCKMFGYPQPPNIMNPYKDPACEAWRATTGLYSGDTWQRVSSKACRYGLAYGKDERAIHEVKDIDLLMRQAGLDKKGVEAIAKAYLDSKPKLKAWKRRVWDQVYETHEVRTPLGRRKRLFITNEEYMQWKQWGRPGDAGKQGLNHLAQGQVADMMNLTIIAIKCRWPESRLAYQAHDGLTMVFPESVNPFPEIRKVVEREWPVGKDRVIHSTADWGTVGSDGNHKEVTWA